jgi:hypothetical protein
MNCVTKIDLLIKQNSQMFQVSNDYEFFKIAHAHDLV